MAIKKGTKVHSGASTKAAVGVATKKAIGWVEETEGGWHRVRFEKVVETWSMGSRLEGDQEDGRCGRWR